MSKIFQVLSNLNHSGALYKTGDFVEAELEEFQHLVKDGVMRLIENAATIKDAIEMIGAENSRKSEQAADKPAPAPANTWEPAKADAANTSEETAKTDAASASTAGQANIEAEKTGNEPGPGQVGTGDNAPSGDNL